MNVNLQPQTPAIKEWLKSANLCLSKIGIISARLDSEILLSHAIGKDRTYLHAHGDELIDLNTQDRMNELLEMRLKRFPIAYIVGHKEFYGREFIVSKDTLIPRPGSEDIITLLKNIIPSTIYPLPSTNLIDVGTGSGCLGITAKLEFPMIDVTLIDISKDALKIAELNSNKHSVMVSFKNSNLLKRYQKKANIIIANLPYVDAEWDRSPETNYEPSRALFADDGGTSLIKKLIVESVDILLPEGFLILEADPVQHNSIINYAKKHSFIFVNKLGYALAFILDDLIDTVKK